jgi:nicotinamide-nucleotide amidase
MHDALVADLAQRLFARSWRLATAESCTGGLVAAACTGLAGSSDWFERGFVTYSNAAKTELLGVPAELIATHGAVSEPVARAMAEGAMQRAGVDLAVGITGIAGPGGGSASKPVGTVWIAVAAGGAATLAELRVWPGDRRAVREAAAGRALELLRDAAGR